MLCVVFLQGGFLCVGLHLIWQSGKTCQFLKNSSLSPLARCFSFCNACNPGIIVVSKAGLRPHHNAIRRALHMTLGSEKAENLTFWSNSTDFVQVRFDVYTATNTGLSGLTANGLENSQFFPLFPKAVSPDGFQSQPKAPKVIIRFLEIAHNYQLTSPYCG
jgi:hypothetical protein